MVSVILSSGTPLADAEVVAAAVVVAGTVSVAVVSVEIAEATLDKMSPAVAIRLPTPESLVEVVASVVELELSTPSTCLLTTRGK